MTQEAETRHSAARGNANCRELTDLRELRRAPPACSRSFANMFDSLGGQSNGACRKHVHSGQSSMTRVLAAIGLSAAVIVLGVATLMPSAADAERRNCAEGVFRVVGGKQLLHWRNICNQPITIKWWTEHPTTCSQGCLTGKLNPGQWTVTGTTTRVTRSEICSFADYSASRCVFSN